MIKFKRLTIALLALLSISATAWAQETITVTWTLADLQADAESTTFTKDGVTIQCDTRMSSGKSFNGPVTISTTLGNFTKIEITGGSNAPIQNDNFTNVGNVSTWTGNTASLTLPDAIAYANQFVFTIAPAGPEVTIDNTLEQPEATFTMPQYDVTATYALKRDMAVDVTAEVGDGSDGYRIRIKKDGNDYVPVNTEEMLISVSDDLDDQNPIDLTANTDFTLLVQKKGEGDTWTDLSNEDKLSVGTFRYKVTGTGNYTGTIYSNEFQLFQGYEVTIPAGEYITYYKDEALMVEDEDAQLYTITAVGSDKATATELKVAPAETPLLVKNNAKETKTIVLIPTKETADNVKAADEFKGTLTAGTIAASTDAVSRYAFNGLQFVWVKNAIEIGANKCWLEIGAEKTSARSLNIDFGDGTTGISNVLSDGTAGDWYDLNGRKYATKPTRKGVYINNGRKVVIK